MSDQIWWYENSDEPQGPVTASELRQMIEDGRLSMNTLVWDGSMPEWVPASQIPELILPPGESPEYSTKQDDDDTEYEPHAPEPINDGTATEGINQVQPWVRLVARIFDYAICVVLIGPFLANYLGVIDEGTTKIFFVPVLTFCWVIIETAFLSTFGKTPGKYLFGITVTDAQGNKPNQSTAFIRSINVWVLGMGMGLPIIYIVTLYMGYNRLKKNGTTPWDQKAQSIVIHTKKFFS